MPGSLCDVLPAAAALLDVEDAVDRLAVADWVGADRIDRVVNSMVRQLESSGESEIPSKQIGEKIMEAL